MNIIANFKKYFLISGVAMLVGLAFMFYNISNGNGAFNYDVEFTGGTELTIDIGQDFETADIVALITEAVGEMSPQVQHIVGTTSVNIKMKSLDSEARKTLTTAFTTKYNLQEGTISMTDISASISDEMKETAVKAVIAACAGILVYVTIRFRDFRTGASAIVPLLHDSALVVLAYAVFRIPLNYSFIAVVLTILGFSINATIVIFDRIRENRKMLVRPSIQELIDTSVSQTFKRCIYTSLTVLIVTICLYVNGVPAIKEFTLPIIVGVIWGTYSSIFLSGSVLYILTVGFKKAFAKTA